MKKQNVVIIGQGEIGKALYKLLRTKHNVAIECWDVDVKACPVKKPLDIIIPKANIVFLCIPSWAIRLAAKDLFQYLKKTTLVVSVSKGIDRDRDETVDELLREVFPKSQKYALLSGPMLAEEMLAGKLSAAVVASKDKNAFELLKYLFKGMPLRLSPSTDLRGTALCGVLKNIYSIGFAMATTLGAGDNYRGYYLMLVLEEMSGVISALGGHPNTAYTYAGLGDFTATAFSQYSKNHEYGVTLAKKGRVPFESEGSISIKPLRELLGKKEKQFYLLNLISDIVSGKRKPRSILDI
jgi:glycerol-3-phosphate dehydrogenase (NAD(P)+)